MKTCALSSSNLPSVIDRSFIIYPSMTRGKLLDNDTQLFIFISILIMTQGTQKKDNRTDSRNDDSRKKNSYNLLNGKAWLTVVVVDYRLIMHSSCPLT